MTVMGFATGGAAAIKSESLDSLFMEMSRRLAELSKAALMMQFYINDSHDLLPRNA